MRLAKLFIAAAIGGAVSLAVFSESNMVLALIVGAAVGASVVLFYFVYPKHVGYAEHKRLRDH